MQPTTYRAEDWLGRSAERRERITAAMLEQFVSLSGDRSPIHVSDQAARDLGFQGRVVHGLLLGSLVSGLVGVELPGAKGCCEKCKRLLLPGNPCYVDDGVCIRFGGEANSSSRCRRWS